MKKKSPKPLTLLENIKDAQKVVASWSKEKRESVQLEGFDLYLNRKRNENKIPD
jgi:small nuclear ribonucleoprotein (snRNP)-like protein